MANAIEIFKALIANTSERELAEIHALVKEHNTFFADFDRQEHEKAQEKSERKRTIQRLEHTAHAKREHIKKLEDELKQQQLELQDLEYEIDDEKTSYKELCDKHEAQAEKMLARNSDICDKLNATRERAKLADYLLTLQPDRQEPQEQEAADPQDAQPGSEPSTPSPQKPILRKRKRSSEPVSETTRPAKRARFASPVVTGQDAGPHPDAFVFYEDDVAYEGEGTIYQGTGGYFFAPAQPTGDYYYYYDWQ